MSQKSKDICAYKVALLSAIMFSVTLANSWVDQQTTWTMLWQNSLSITGQVHEKLKSICFFNNNKLSNEPLACYCIIFINYELCLSAYWQRKLTNEQPRSFVVTEKKIVPRSGPFDFRRVGGWIILKKSSCKYSLLFIFFFRERNQHISQQTLGQW